MKILLGRTWLGFGDWVMFTNILLMVNKQRPDIEIDLLAYDFVPNKWLRLPFDCGVRLRLVDHHTKPEGYDGYLKHVVYDNPQPPNGEHLLVNMLRVFNTALKLNIKMDWENNLCIPRRREEILLPDSPYVLMPSAGAATASSSPKTYTGLSRLCQIIGRELFPVVQVGSVGDPELPGAIMRYDDLPFEKFSYLFTNAAAGVFLENGLAHWAGNHMTPCYVLFCSNESKHPKPSSVHYPKTVPLIVRGKSPEEVWKMMEGKPLPERESRLGDQPLYQCPDSKTSGRS